MFYPQTMYDMAEKQQHIRTLNHSFPNNKLHNLISVFFCFSIYRFMDQCQVSIITLMVFSYVDAVFVHSFSYCSHSCCCCFSLFFFHIFLTVLIVNGLKGYFMCLLVFFCYVKLLTSIL